MIEVPVLLDANVLIGLLITDHPTHQRIRTWWRTEGKLIATCPITQGALVRFCLRHNGSEGLGLAMGALQTLGQERRHRFWPDDLQYTILPLDGLRGHNQVTDLYLVALAQSKGTVLVTLDRALAAWHPSSCLFLG